MGPLHFLFTILFACSTPFFLHTITAGLYDFPTASLPTTWANNLSLDSVNHNVTYPDGASIRVLLLRGRLGPSFACGFYCTEPCDAFLFAIFIVYTNSASDITRPMDASPQVIWSANRGRAVKENATLRFSQDGNLVLCDFDGTLVWSTNTSGRSVAGMILTETGNLELVDKQNVSVWSSVDHPTDSWVLGQTLRQGQRLTANVSATNWAQGQFYLNIVDRGFKAYVDSNPPQLYYQSIVTGPKYENKSTYITFSNGSLDIFALFALPPQPDNSVPLRPSSSLQYIRLESDGHLRLYEWGVEPGWKPVSDVLSVFPDGCAYPTVCGEYGICSNRECSCPTGINTTTAYFRQVNVRQANLGCSPMTPLTCQSNENHQFLALNNLSYFNYIDPDALAFDHTNEESCRQACLRNCSCKAALFQYGGNASDGSCYLPSKLFSMKNNNPGVSHFNSSAFVKVAIPVTVPASNTQEGSSKKVGVAVIVGVALGVLVVVSLVIGFVIVLVRRNKRRYFEEVDEFGMVAGIPSRFSFDELKTATENFCRKLGGGGFGSVFEGTLRDGTRVAVKRLDGVGQGKKEFLAEVETIGSIHHINLVRLMGFCAEKSYRLLVYEYMCNGSLDKWIFYKGQENALDWQTRRRIITDIAKGLSYLHEECRQKIAHLDIKPQNILLDQEFNAKVSDFGLSKLIDRDQSQVMTRMRGTPGYLAPEWLTSLITEKADVYSFGVVVMEIVCGRKNLDYSQPEECIHLISLLQDKFEENQLSDIIDSHSADMQLNVNEIIEMMKLAMWCLQSYSNKRPSMSAVVKVLEGSMSVETNIDYKFSTPAPFVSQNANINDASAPPSAFILSGPR